MIKNLTAGTIALAIAVFFASSVLIAQASNLVPNGDLEAGTTNSPTGWVSNSWGTLARTFSYPVAGNGSARAARVQITSYTSGDAKWYFNPISVTPGTIYQITDNYRSNVATEVVVMFVVNGAPTYHYVAAPTSSGGSWANFSGQITAPAQATSMTVFHLIEQVGYLEIDNMSVTSGATSPTPTSTPPTLPAKPVINSFTANPTTITQGQSSTLSWSVTGSSTSLSISGIGAVTGTSRVVSPTATTTYTLTASNAGGTSTAQVTVNVKLPVATTTPPTPPSGNLIQNGNFEAGTTNNPTNWNASWWGSMTATFTYPATGRNSTKGARVVVSNRTSGDAKWATNHIPVSSNTIYKYTQDYTSNVTTNFSVEYKMADGSFQYQWLGDMPRTTGWVNFTKYITVPKGAVSLTPLHSLVSNGSLSIDNASLVAMPASPFPSGMVSFTFDDALVSQYQNALPILKAAGMNAGFYVVTNMPASGIPMYMTWAQIKDAMNQGFEIGGHSRSHPALATVSATQLQSEVQGSYDDLVAQGITPKGFLYPLGSSNNAVVEAVKNAGYGGARGSNFGLNAPFNNRYNLHDIRLDSSTNLDTIKKHIDQTFEDKRWLVLEIHDVIPSGGDFYAITPAFFQAVVDYIKQKGITVVPLSQGFNLMQQ